jgi:radial spoke head protein 9
MVCVSTLKKGKYFHILILDFRFQIELAIQQLLNESAPTDFDELLFWGRISAVKTDYYIALGVCYCDRYEFPEKKFFWCSQSNGMKFTAFPGLNDQHSSEYNIMASQLFQGEPMKVLKKVENAEEQAAHKAKLDAKAAMEKDPLASTEEEDPDSLIVKIDLKEIDRLHYHIRAIENDCHIIPQGSMKLNQKHEVQRNEAFAGLNSEECFDLKFYSHFRNAQQDLKKAGMEADDAIFNRAFLDDVHSDKPIGCWSL